MSLDEKWDERNLERSICAACRSTRAGREEELTDNLIATKKRLMEVIENYRDVVDAVIELTRLIEGHANDR
jgi:hypothetical protein